MSTGSEGHESKVPSSNQAVTPDAKDKNKPVIAALTAQGQFGSSWTGIPFNYIVAKPKK